MKLRLIIWPLVAVFFVFVVVARWNVNIPCEQCGKKCYQEPLLARYAAGFDTNFLHFECVDAWCKAHPIRLDENGKIIKSTNK